VSNLEPFTILHIEGDVHGHGSGAWTWFNSGDVLPPVALKNPLPAPPQLPIDLCESPEPVLSDKSPMSEDNEVAWALTSLRNRQCDRDYSSNCTTDWYHDSGDMASMTEVDVISDTFATATPICLYGGNDYGAPVNFLPSPRVGTLAQYINPRFWHDGIEVDLTSQLADVKPQIPYSTPFLYYTMEFLHAMELLRPHIEELPGGEFFHRQTIKNPTPGTWKLPEKDWPPVTKKNVAITRFGMTYACDHWRSSGCQVKMLVQRNILLHPDRDVFSICISKG
jgi:hypothetical protein